MTRRRDAPQSRRFRLSSTHLILAGTIFVLGSPLLSQAWYGGSTVVMTRGIVTLEVFVYASIGLTLVGIVLALLGATAYLKQRTVERETNQQSSFVTGLSQIMAYKRTFKVFAIAAIGYGLFFGFVSGTLVLRLGSTFTQAYGVPVPSAIPVVCCGTLGQMPQLVLYLTQQFAVLLIPINLILLFAVSWLVGLNSAIAYFAYENKAEMRNSRWMSGLGAVLGLFTACPTCAGIFFLTLLGLGGATALSLTLSSFQTVFIGTGIPILLVMPVLALRPLSRIQTCTSNERSLK